MELQDILYKTTTHILKYQKRMLNSKDTLWPLISLNSPPSLFRNINLFFAH